MMNNQDPFERELGATLDDVASEPAPDDLVDRVARIPQEVPAAQGSSRRGWGALSRYLGASRATLQLTGGLAAIAVLFVIGALIVATLPGGGPFAAQRPGALATPAPTGRAPSSVTPTAVPSPTPSPQVAGPAGGPVPAGFKTVSVTFVSADLGWVLGTASCNTGTCISILRTTDGGQTWASIPAPATTLAPGGITEPGSTGVSALRFADPLNGWVFGPELWATHDGGATWHQVAIPGFSSGYSATALETSAGSVQAVFYSGTGTTFQIASSPVSTDAWQISPTVVAVGAGPVPQIQLVLSGSAGWVVNVNRVVVGGARLTNGTWTAWTPPCEQVLGPMIISATSASDLVAACDGGVWGPPKDTAQNGEHLFVSTDGGTTFTMSTASVPLNDPSAMAAPGATSIVMGGSLGQTQGPAIVATYDGGQNWITTHLQGTVQVTFLGFTTPTQGVAIVQSGGEGGSLLMTRDGGQTWSTVTFGAP